MTELQSIAALPVTPRPETVEEVVVKGAKTNEEGFTFWDFLDVINPLQHIPVVNTVYREMTGDEIRAPAKMIGSAILGGPVGFAAAMVDTVIEDRTGKDMGGHAMAFLRGEGGGETGAAVAAANVQSVKTASDGREFIPAALTAATSAASLATPEPEESEARRAADAPRPEETEAAIAAAAAAAPPGMVFKPLPGRRDATFDPVKTAHTTPARFMPLDRGPGRAYMATPTATRAETDIDSRTTAQLRAQMAVAGLSGQGADFNPVLDATAPAAEAEKLAPAPDPFATARRILDESSPIAVPAAFDKAMMNALDKYEAMKRAQQAAGNPS